MKRLIACSLVIFVLLLAAMPAEAGLFGPSKKELMGRMIENQHAAMHQAQASHATLSRMEVEQARQTELLRQIAGQTARAADAGQRAADASQGLMQHIGTMDPRMLRKGAPNMGDIQSAPDLPPSGTLDPRTLQRGTSNMGDIKSVPDINIEGPILQGTRGRVYYAKQPPAKRSQPASQYTNYSLRN
jgi:hypothetical protein